jgi:hypothetical protein
MAFWWRLLAGSDWSHLLGMVSPSFFDVISARELSRCAATLARNWFDRDGYLTCVAGLRAKLAECDVGMEIAPTRPTRSLVPFGTELPIVGESKTLVDGALLLRLFFLQIVAAEAFLLDLRAARFHRVREVGPAVFSPLPLWTRWRPDFVDAIRQLYLGFYGDEPSLFLAATRSLGVSSANEVFERAFGGEAKRASRYSIATFRATFHEVFIKCRDSKATLHPDFITLGIMLATTYDHLEFLGGVHDAQAAYRAVVRPRGGSGC